MQGYWSKTSWGFPKGKVNEEENPVDCAVREVHEETGFDIRSRINEDEFVDFMLNEQRSRLYIIRDVPMNTKFTPLTRKEIKACVDQTTVSGSAASRCLFVSVDRMVPHQHASQPQARHDLQTGIRPSPQRLLHGLSIHKVSNALEATNF